MLFLALRECYNKKKGMLWRYRIHKTMRKIGEEKSACALFLLTLCLSSGIFLAISPSTTTVNKKEPQLNVLLITIDTLRSDRLSCYSREHVETPRIDGLARKGILFSRAFAHTPTTLPSHANILLGMTPPYHGVHENGNFIVKEEFLTLAEHLKSYGYSTGAFVGAYPLDSRFGLAQGFDVYDDDYGTLSSQKFGSGERKAEIVMNRAASWLKTQKSPWFLWIHLFDPHDPYEPPEPFKTKYKYRPYDGEVAYVDTMLGRFFKEIRINDQFKKTLVVFTGDHGESLGDHGEMTHGYLAYNSTLWIPLIIAGPGLKPEVIQSDVTHTDIFPTVCDILRIKKPSFLQGVSLLPLTKGKKLPERAIYFESLYPYLNLGWAPLKGYISGREKYIDSPLPELYDLEKDFEEHHNLFEEKKSDKLESRLAQLVNCLANPGNIKAEQPLDRESRERLKSLGYLSNSRVHEKVSFTPEMDIKTLLPYHNKAMKAMDLYKEGMTQEGIELLKEVITERPDIQIAYSNLATLYKEQGRLNDALEVLKLGQEKHPSSYEILTTYVLYLNNAGLYEDVIQILNKKHLRQMDYDPELWNYLGIAYWSKGDFEEALKVFEKALSLQNDYAVIYSNLGSVYLSLFLKSRDQNAHKKSIQNFKKAIELDPEYALAYNSLGSAYGQVGNWDEAIYYWEKALDLNPDLGYAQFNLGLAFMKKGDKDRAYDYFIKYKNTYSQHLPLRERKELEALIQKCKQ